MCRGTTTWVTAGCVVVSLGGRAMARQAPEPGPTSTSNVKVLPEQPIGGFSNADQLLEALETADEDLRALSADIRYTRDFAVAGDTQVRLGKLWFQDATDKAEKDAPRKRRFAILFESLAFGDRSEKKTQMYNFDGEWLVERYPEEKRMVKRQVVGPGERFDPLRIGEGPLPIPIGQRKADILARYDATLLPPEDGFEEMPAARMADLTKMAQGCVQLLLKPRPERAESDDFKEIRLWYMARVGADGKPGRLLPRLAKTLNRADDTSIVELIRVKVNDQVQLDPAVFDTKTPATGWEVIIQPFRGSIEDANEDRPGRQVAPAGANRASSPTPNIAPADPSKGPESTPARPSSVPSPSEKPK